MGEEGFSKSERILKKAEYSYVAKNGKRYSKLFFKLFVLKRDAGTRRLGLTVSRKVGNAVFRNRIKRILREIFRKNKLLIGWVDIVIIASPEIVNKKYIEIEKAFLEIFSSQNLNHRNSC